MFNQNTFKSIAHGSLALLLGAGLTSTASGYSTRISDSQLLRLFEGKNIFFDMRGKSDTQGWDSAHIRFLDDGNLVGYLFSADLLSLKEPSNDIDNGIWEIDDNRLCIHWSQWDQNTRHCYAIFLNDDVYLAKSETLGLLKGEFDPQY